MKYNVYIDDVSVEAVFNKLGGVGGAKRFLSNELVLVEAPKPEHQLESKVLSINLDSPARLPSIGTVLEFHRGSGIIQFERKVDGVYLDEKRLSLFLSEGQKNGKVICGHDLRTELEIRGNNVGAKVLDVCVDHPELWPDNWKTDLNGDRIYVSFWDDIFRYPPLGDLSVRCGYWVEGRVVSHYIWLHHGWDDSNPSASSVS